MSRVPDKINVGDRVVWENTFFIAPTGNVATAIYSGTVLGVSADMADVGDIRCHSLESEDGMTGKWDLPARGGILLSKLKAVKNARYKL